MPTNPYPNPYEIPVEVLRNDITGVEMVGNVKKKKIVINVLFRGIDAAVIVNLIRPFFPSQVSKQRRLTHFKLHFFFLV